MIPLVLLAGLLGGPTASATPVDPAALGNGTTEPQPEASPFRQRLQRVPLGARVLFGLGVSSLGVGGISIGCGGIILAGDQTTPGTAEHSLYGGQVATANDLGYVGEALLGLGALSLAGAVIWGVLGGGP